MTSSQAAAANSSANQQHRSIPRTRTYHGHVKQIVHAKRSALMRRAVD